MKLTVNKSIILKEIVEVAKYRAKDKNIYLLEATENGIAMKATNGKSFYSNLLPLQVVGEEDLVTVHEVHEAGSVVVSSKFDEVLRKAPGKSVDLTLKDNVITISSTGFKASIPVILEDFPAFPSGEESLLIDSPFDFFEKIAKQTGFAHATSESRPVLTGINLIGNGEVLTATATDSHRLARLSISSQISFDSIVIPAKPFTDALSSFDSDEKVKLFKLPSHVKLQQGDKLICLQLLDGTYPDVSKLIAIPDGLQLVVNKKEILEAIDRALIFAKTDSRKAYPIIRFEQNESLLRVFSFNEEGEIDSDLALTSQSAPLKSVYGVNGLYLMDAIKAYPADELTFHVSENNVRPIFIKNPNSELVSLVLPVKIAN